MSTTKQLENWAEKNISNFLGVYSSDTLPNPLEIKPPASLIVNYDPHNMPGSHWVACTINLDTVEWFDSFGLQPDADDLILGHKTNFRKFLSTVCHKLGIKKYSWNTADLQSLDAQTCGHYSLWFCKNGSWDQFGPDRKKNDKIILQLVQLNYFNKESIG